MHGPAIDTNRLTLRPHRLEEFPESAAMWSDPEVTRYIGGRPATREETWARLLRYVGHWVLLGYGFWAVREKTSGRFVGEVGFADFKRDLPVSLLDGAPEMGWALARWAQGKGYATEAVRAALEWAGGHFGPRRIVCLISPNNLPSLRVAQKCGFRELARTTYRGDPTLVFERTPPPP